MSTFSPTPFHAPAWHYQAQTPVVDDRYVDRTTGELRSTADEKDVEYVGGPPNVDVIISNIHELSNEGIMRASRSFPMEVLLGQIMKVVEERKLLVDCIMATQFAIRVTLQHELTKEKFGEIAWEMIDVQGHGEGESIKSGDEEGQV